MVSEMKVAPALKTSKKDFAIVELEL